MIVFVLFISWLVSIMYMSASMNLGFLEQVLHVFRDIWVSEFEQKKAAEVHKSAKSTCRYLCMKPVPMSY